MCDVCTSGIWRESGFVCNGRRTRAEGMRRASDDADTRSGAGRDSRGDPVSDCFAMFFLVRFSAALGPSAAVLIRR